MQRPKRDVGESSVGQLGRGKSVLLILSGALIVALCIALFRRNAEPVSAIRDADRHPLYERTLENLRFCRAYRQSGPLEFCRHQAEFILTFPECDESCSELARLFVAHPTR